MVPVQKEHLLGFVAHATDYTMGDVIDELMEDLMGDLMENLMEILMDTAMGCVRKVAQREHDMQWVLISPVLNLDS